MRNGTRHDDTRGIVSISDPIRSGLRDCGTAGLRSGGLLGASAHRFSRGAHRCGPAKLVRGVANSLVGPRAERNPCVTPILCSALLFLISLSLSGSSPPSSARCSRQTPCLLAQHPCSGALYLLLLYYTLFLSSCRQTHLCVGAVGAEKRKALSTSRPQPQPQLLYSPRGGMRGICAHDEDATLPGSFLQRKLLPKATY